MWPNFIKGLLIWKINNFDQTLIFSHSPFHHLVQEVNEIWYPWRASINLLRYQISSTSCTRWWNGKWLHVRFWSKLFSMKLTLFNTKHFKHSFTCKCNSQLFIRFCNYGDYHGYCNYGTYLYITLYCPFQSIFTTWMTDSCTN